MKVIDDKFRARLRELAVEFFSTRETANITKLNIEMLIPAGIDYKEYVQPGKSLLKKFFEQFPEIFHVFDIEVNGGKQWQVELACVDTWENCAEEFGAWLHKIVDEHYNGKMLDSYFPAALEAYASPRIKAIRALFTKGQKAMLDDLAARGCIIHDTSDPTGGALNIQTKNMLATEDGEVGFMHSICFMGYWNNENSKLNKICANGYTSYSEIVAHNMIKSILLNKVRIAETQQGRRYVFDTGLKTGSNEIVYCVLKDNPLFSVNSTARRYLRDMWAYNGMEADKEEAELWNEIYTKCNLGNAMPNSFYIREKIITKINTVEAMIEKSDSVLSQIGEAIRDGKQINSELIEFIHDYHEAYESIREKLGYFNIKNDENLSVSFIQERISSKNINTNALQEIRTLVDELCERYIELLTAYGQSTQKAENDKAEFMDLMEMSADEPQKISECFERLEVYFDFAYADKRNQEHMEYFGIKIPIVVINNGTSVYNIENRILPIVEKIKVKRNYLYYEEAREENEELHYLTGEDGVSVAVAKAWDEAEQNIFSDPVSEYFPKLGDMEEIIISGTNEELAKYIDDNSYILDDTIAGEDVIMSLPYENSTDKLECAKRLYAVCGNKNRQAEHMLLRAKKNAESVMLLLDIMRAEERTEDYLYIFDRAENIAGIGLSYYCDAMKFRPDIIPQLAAKKPELNYCVQSLEILIEYYASVSNEQAAELCRKNLERISLIQLNAFELAVIEERYEDAKKLTEENIADIDEFPLEIVAEIPQKLADIIDNKKSMGGAFALYSIQNNYRGAAESLLWLEAFSDNREEALCILSEILYHERRLDEFKKLTDVYADIVFKKPELRKANIIYAINNNQESIEGLMLNNICDFMDDEVRALLLESNQANVYTNPILFETVKMVDDEVKKAIICMGTELRKIFEQGTDLSSFGYSEQETASMSKCFKSENYPKGKTMLETAQRIHAFISNKYGLAQSFYKACLPDMTAAEKLCEICCRSGEYESAYELFCEYGELTELKPVLYIECLIALDKNEQFVQFYDIVDEKYKSNTIRIKYCYLAGEFRDSSVIKEEYDKISLEKVLADKELSEELIYALNNSSLYNELYVVLSLIFNYNIENMIYDDIYKTATGYGIIDLLQIEQYVDSMENDDDMIFRYWEKCVLNEYSEEKFEKLYADAVLQISQNTYEISKIGFILLLFPEKAEEIAENVINTLKAVEQENSALAEFIIRYCSNYIDENKLLTMFDGMKNELNFSDIVLLEKNYRQNRSNDMMIVFLCDCIINNITQKDSGEAAELICSLIDAAIEEKYLDAKNLELLVQALTKLISINPERSLLDTMHKVYAYFGDSRDEVVALLLNKDNSKNSAAPERGIYEVLKDTIENNTPERVIELCRQWSAMEACVDEKETSEEENSQDIKAWFVIKNCDDAKGWNECKQLPMCQNELIYSKVLYICISYGLSDWKDYIEYCFKNELYDFGLDGTYRYLCEIDIADKGIIGIQKILCSLAEVENIGKYVSDKSMVEKILGKLAEHYQTPKGHTYEELRALILIAECFDTESFLIENSIMADAVTGEYDSAGVAIAGKLLLKGDYELAGEFVKRAGSFASDNAFCRYISSIINMAHEEITEELKKKEVVDFIEIMQPMGQYPSYTEMKEYLFTAVRNNTVLTAARALYKLLTINPNDGAISICLYLAAKNIHDARYIKEKCLYIQNSLYTWLKHPVYKFKDVVPCIIMIVAANLYINKHFPELVDSEEDIDSSLSKSANMLYNELAERIDLIERENLDSTASELADINSGEEQIDMSIVEAVMTGEWGRVLVWMYNNNKSLSVYSKLIKNVGAGIMKSVICGYESTESDVEGVRFLDWINAQFEEINMAKSYIKFVTTLRKHQKYRNSIHTITEIPFEEKVIFPECVKMYISKTDYVADVLASGLSLGAYITHHLNLKDESTWVYTYINKNASDYLSARNYTAAHILYSVMENLYRHFDIFIDADGKKFVTIPREKGIEFEKRQSLKRVAGILAQDPFTIEKFAGGLSAHSCINICTSCLSYPIADEFNLIKYRMTRENQKIAELVYDIVCKKDAPSVKLDWVSACDLPDAIAGLYFILNKVAGGATKEGREAWDRYAMSSTIGKQPTFLYSKPHSAAYSLIEYDFAEIDKSGNDEIIEMPEYVERLNNVFREFIDETGTANEIEEEYGYIQYNDVEKRRIKAYRIYRASVNTSSYSEYLSCVNLGIAEYRYQKAALENKNDKNIVTLFFEVFDFALKSKTVNDEVKTFVTAAIKDIIRSYSDVDTLTESFLQNKMSFSLVTGLLASESDINSYKVILKNISEICDVVGQYRDISQGQELCTELIKLNRDNSDNKNMGASWRDTYYSLKTLLSDKITALRARPILECDVLSKTGLHDGEVFGQIKNIGTTVAYDVKIRILFNDGSISNDYEVSKITPDTKVPFKISYYVDSSEDTIDFSVHCSYYDKDGKEFPMPPENAQMKMVSREYAKLPSAYDVNTLQFTVVNDERNMYGRMSETKFLEEAVKGEFRDYKNIVIRGLRRSGKSSLLNYMVYYIQNNCEKVLPVYIDCEATKGTVYSVFVEKFHTSLREWIKAHDEFDGEISIDEINELFVSVSSENFEADDLAEFYIDLSKVLKGYRLVLVFDEFDTVLSYYAEDENNADINLHRSLRELVNNSAIRECVHFVFCGSDLMYKFEKDGGSFHQLFQSLNSLDIGNMGKEDMRDMLVKTFALDSVESEYNMEYTPEAIDWIYHYTRGMVWHTKLLVNDIINELSEKRRNVVYPSDVCKHINVLTNGGSCEQLWIACEEEEKRIIGAMQHMINKPYGTIDFDTIVKAVGENLTTEQIRLSLKFLTKLGLIETRVNSYYFPNELYRKYFKCQASKKFGYEYFVEPTEPEVNEVFSMVSNKLATWL